MITRSTVLKDIARAEEWIIASRCIDKTRIERITTVAFPPMFGTLIGISRAERFAELKGHRITSSRSWWKGSHSSCFRLTTIIFVWSDCGLNRWCRCGRCQCCIQLVNTESMTGSAVFEVVTGAEHGAVGEWGNSWASIEWITAVALSSVFCTPINVAIAERRTSFKALWCHWRPRKTIEPSCS